MKRFFSGMLVGLLLTILMIVGGGVLLVRSFAPESAVTDSEQLLVLNWSGMLPGHRVDAMETDFDSPVTLNVVKEALYRAAESPFIKGVLIESNLSLPREYLHELQPAFTQLRDSGKPVLAHLEMAQGRGYLVAAMADRISLSPAASGGLFYSGPALHRTYMREALQKLGVKVHVIHAGEAKGFGESYAADEMSPAVRANLEQLVTDLLDLELGWIAEARDLDRQQLKDNLLNPDRLGMSAQEALEAGLVDHLETRTDWLDAVEGQFGDLPRLSLRDWIKEGDHGNPFEMDKGIQPSDHVAVLWAEGSIYPGSESQGRVRIASRSLVDEIRELSEAESVRAVVLRVESPGGSALASEEVYQELKLLAAEKPLWVSAGPVAASGGYYLSLPGEQLWLSPYTVAGSIGVVGLIPDFSGTTDLLGLHPQSIAHTPLAELGNVGAAIPADLLNLLRARMEEVYQEFRLRVESHRPVRPVDYMQYAEGRVFMGARAKQLGLADALGNLEDCLAALTLDKDLEGLETVHYPRQESLLDLLLSNQLKPGDFLPSAELESLVEDLERTLQEELVSHDLEKVLRTEWDWKLN